MARKSAANPLLTPAVCDICSGKVTWRNDKRSLCQKCYERIIRPMIPATQSEIAFQKRLRDVQDWIAKHPEFKAKREACQHMLKTRGLFHLLPDALK